MEEAEAEAEAVDEEEVPATAARVVGDYVLGQMIGSGSFAVVWRARHRRDGHQVALKEIDKRRVDNSKIRDGLLKEIAILRNISHPNIVRLYDALETKNKIFLVLEYCSGGDLASYIQRYGNRLRISEDVSRHFMRQLAQGLKILRENNLIHRDLKPQNLLLSTSDKTPVVKIGDFGFARYLMPEGLADTLCGSPLYMAPEIIQDRKYDAKADLWSVGAILFQLVTGKLPFNGDNQIQLFQNIMSNDLQFPHDVLVSLSSECVNLCRSLLQRNPVERLAFEEFFNHNFMDTQRISAIDTQSEKSASVNLSEEDSLNLSKLKTGSTTQGLLCTISAVADSLEYIEREYVLVHSNFTSMETLSSTEASSPSHYRTRHHLLRKDMVDKGDAGFLHSSGHITGSISGIGPMQSSHISALSSVSQPSTSPEITQEVSSLHPTNRLKLFGRYIKALADLAHEKLSIGSTLESFSIQLVILAIWKEAVQICNEQMTSINNDALNGSSGNQSPQGDHLSVNTLDGVDYTSPFSVCSWAKRGFLLACDRAEELSGKLKNIDVNMKMPDAMEIIYQTALEVGKNGAVEELMGFWKKATTSYKKSITLLEFILLEAMSLPTNPPFSLSPSDWQRLQRYIIILRARLKDSEMAEICTETSH